MSTTPPQAPSVLVEKKHNGHIHIITINRPAKKNAVDGIAAALLYEAFIQFEKDATARVAILTGMTKRSSTMVLVILNYKLKYTGSNNTFCAGADLHAFSAQEGTNKLDKDMKAQGPMGPSRLLLSKVCVSRYDKIKVANFMLLLTCQQPVIAAIAGHAGTCNREQCC